MLNFFNKHIFLDFEVFHTLTESMIMFCENPYVSYKRQEEKYLETISLNDFLNRPEQFVFMNFNQLKSFIKEWYKHTDLMVKINIDKWIKDYYDCIKIMSDIEGDNLDYTSFNSIFRPRQKWIIDNLDINDDSLPSPIIIDKIIEPELSWLIDDVLYCKKLGIPSIYENKFNQNIEINNYKCMEYINKANRFGINYINFKPYNNCNSLEDLCYLYFPLSGESIISNYIHIKKCLEQYLEK